MKHKLDEAWSIEGAWAESPNAPQASWVPGKLHFDPEDGFEIELFGRLPSHQGPNGVQHPFSRLYGLLADGGESTFFDAFTTRLSYNAVGSAQLRGNGALLGCVAPKGKKPGFTKSRSSLGNLEGWICWAPIREDRQAKTISFAVPKPLSIKLPSHKAKLEVHAKINNRATLYHREITYTAQVEIATTRGRKAEPSWHIEAHAVFRDLLTFLSNTPSWFRALEVVINRYNSATVLGIRNVVPKERSRRRELDPMISRRVSNVPFEVLVPAWFAHTAMYRKAHDLLLGAYYDRMPYTEFTFLAAWQAMEAYARVKLAAANPPPKKIVLLQCITHCIDALPPWVKKRLFKDPAGFALLAKDTRNVHTHHHSSSKVYKGIDLYYAAERLRLVLALNFMLDLGFDRNVLQNSVLANPDVAFHLTKWRG